ncbi:MAG: ATP-binding protein [Bacteroidetes bacterium]|nr:ATP-binding protein [Bacteroidota bacterium]MBS1591643.1 ATP-binding protein [Bacteroidota bacterium]
MIQRAAIERLLKLANSFRSVAVVGPRQSGKTTLCRKSFPTKPYISLENPDILEFATKDPRAFLNQFANGAILDEVQKAPHLFSYLQEILDATKKKGLFILIGSNNFLLQENITQTLSGRIAYIQLLPLSLQELQQSKKLKVNYTWHIFNGGYPEQIARKINATDWYNAYISTYIERDVRQLKNISNLSLFMKLLKLCAGRTGQILNLASLANDCGLDPKTVSAWLSILQSSYIIYLLKPYHQNFNKRIIKSPKLYFYNTGVACALLGITDAKQITTHATKGFLFENMVVNELLKQRFNAGKTDNLFYWRDKTGNEIDILLDDAGKLTAIELKAGETISASFFKGLEYFAALNKKPIIQELIYGGKQEQKRSNGIKVKPWNKLIS